MLSCRVQEYYDYDSYHHDKFARVVPFVWFPNDPPKPATAAVKFVVHLVDLQCKERVNSRARSTIVLAVVCRSAVMMKVVVRWS